jgi:hypothetical protein
MLIGFNIMAGVGFWGCPIEPTSVRVICQPIFGPVVTH